MASFTTELRTTVRRLRRRPVFSLTAVALLALGIGAVTAVFALVDAVLLEPMPIAHPERLVWLWQSDPEKAVPKVEVSYPVLRDLRERSSSFEALAATPSSVGSSSLDLEGSSLDVRTAMVSANFFSVLGAEPTLGRTFLAEEDVVGASPVVIVSHGFWQRHLGGVPEVLHRRLRLDGVSYRVVGVAPAGFVVPLGAELWIPLEPAIPQYVEHRGLRFVHGLGLLAPGVEREQAAVELGSIVRQIGQEYPSFPTPPVVELVPVVETLVGASRPLLLLSLGAVLLVFGVATANVAHLFLVRSREQRRDLAIRATLGAGRGELARQLLAETLVLGLFALVAGLLLAQLAIPLLRAAVPAQIPRLDAASLDGSAFAVAVWTALLASFFSAFLPALWAALRIESAESLRAQAAGGEAGGAGRGTRGFLAVSEVALALVLLVATGLLAQSLARLEGVDPGFDPRGVTTLRLQLPTERYAEPAARAVFFERLEAELAALPGVEAAGAVLIRPLEGVDGWDVPFTVDGQSAEDQKSNTPANFQVVGNGYFETLSIPLLAGRVLGAGDTETAQAVAVVSESFARRHWPDRTPIGRRLKIGPPESAFAWLTVVGVVADVRYRQWRSTTPDLYVPLRQNPYAVHTPYSDFVVRSGLDAAAMIPAIRATVAALDPELPLREVAPLSSLVAQRLAPDRFAAGFAGLFAAVALLLALVGIYGVLSYAVAAREKELAIRVALGAHAGRLLRLVLGEALVLAVSGVLLGSLLAIGLAQTLRSVLFEVAPLDAPTYVAVACLVVAAAMAAAILPARRAARVDPLDSLRGA